MPSEQELRKDIDELRKRKRESQRLIRKHTDQAAPGVAKKAWRNFIASLRRINKSTAKRIPKLRKRLQEKKAGGAKKAVQWARAKIGTTESPPYSNWGPEIGEWTKYTGYSGPVYWCGCFVCYAVVKVAGANIPNRVRLGYHLYIKADAEAGVNGLTSVPLSQAKAGDIVCFSFEHIALVAEDYKGGPTLSTIDGNTSPNDSGSQNNGGGVYPKNRGIGDVIAVARPDY